MSQEQKQKTNDFLQEAFEIAKDNRKLEIELLWKRTTIFWGFLTFLFLGVAKIYGEHKYLAIVLSNLGFIFSVIWTFANRGSKAWQESYELRAELFYRKIHNIKEVDFDAYDKVYSQNKNHESFILYRPAGFSLSKLLMLVSDITLVFWLGVNAWILQEIFKWDLISKENCIIAFLIFSLAYLIVIIGISYSKKTGKEVKDLEDNIDKLCDSAEMNTCNTATTQKSSQKKNQFRIEEIESWRKEISPKELIFKKYSIFEKILIWSSALIGGGSIYIWFYLNHIMWYWLLLFIPILSVFVPVQLLKKKKEKIIRDHCDRLSIDRNIEKPRLSLIQQKIIEKKLGINTTNKEYLEFLISHFQNKAKKVKYRYPILIWALTLSLSSYLAFTSGVFANSVNSWQEFVELSKPLLKIIGGILYALAIVEFSLIRTYAIRSKYQTIIEILKNIQLNNLSKKG